MTGMPYRPILVAVTLVLAGWMTVFAQPKLTLEKQEVDLGVVYNGGVVKANVTIQNTGSDVLKILSLRTSCGCTTIKHPKSELAPGEADRIEVEFNSSGFRGKAVKYLGIESNDPQNKYVSVPLIADVREELQPVNNYSLLWFGDIQVGRRQELTYALKNVTTSRIRIKGVRKDTPSLLVSYDKKSVAPSDSIVLTITVEPDKAGYRNESFYVETDSKNQPRVPVRVSFVGVERR